MSVDRASPCSSICSSMSSSRKQQLMCVNDGALERWDRAGGYRVEQRREETGSGKVEEGEGRALAS